MANRILIADGYQISVDSLKTALRKAISYCSLGVETVSGGDLKSGIELVMEHWMTNFFQMGFSLVSELSEEVINKMIDKSPHVTDDPTDPAAVDLERVQAATWKWPKFYLGPYSADGILHRDFCSCADLRAVRKSLEKFI